MERLTDRERAVLRAYGETGSRQAAAHALSKSESTIATQLASARRKLGASSSEQAVALLMDTERVHPSRTNPRRIIDRGLASDQVNAPHPPSAVDTGGVREHRAIFELQPLDRPAIDAEPKAKTYDLTALSGLANMLVIVAGLIFLIAAFPGLLDLFKSLAAWVRRFYP